MSSKQEDDFWNTSLSFGFNFDDEELNNSNDTDIVFLSTEESNVPIDSIISKKSLDLLLDDIKVNTDCAVPSILTAIRKLKDGQHVLLDAYQSFQDKKELFFAAVETYDGNIIITVILYLKSRLKPNIFYQLLSQRREAVKQYTNFLIINNNLDALLELHMATNNALNLKCFYYLIGRGITNYKILFKKLEHFIIDSSDETNDYIEYIKLQMNQDFVCKSVMEQLAITVKNGLEAEVGGLKRQFRIDDFSLQWIILNAFASIEAWKKLSGYFIKSNFLTKKMGLKSTISSETFVLGLSKHKPPLDILDEYLACINDSERNVELVQRLNNYEFVIQYYINQKDRLALLESKRKVRAYSKEYFMIENALQASDKNWKN